jgi:peroxiredoxin Q/BCP
VTDAEEDPMLQTGTQAPDFTLPNQDGEPVTLSSLRGRNVIVYFYPKADTPGCTKQACGVRDRRADYEAANAVVLGISPDPPARLRAFADKYGLPFTLLSDADHSTAEAYGAWVEKSMYGRRFFGNARATFVVDPEGVIAHVIPKVKPATHDELLLAALGELAAA